MKKPIYNRIGFWIAVITVAAVAVLAALFIVQLSDSQISKPLTKEECQQIVDDTFHDLPVSNTGASKYIIDNIKINVDSVELGYQKDMVLHCSYTTLNVKKALSGELDTLMTTAYEFYLSKSKASGADIDLRSVRKPMLALVKDAETVSGKIDLHIYETSAGYMLHMSNEIVDTCTGGILSVTNKINEITHVQYNGESVDISKNGSLRTGLSGPLALENYSEAKPFTGGKLVEAWLDFKEDFHNNFIEGDRYMHLVRGLGITLSLTFLAAIFGILLGFIIAIIR